MDRLTGGGPPGRTDSSGARPSARPLQPELYYQAPPQTKNPWVRCGGIRSPLGLNTGTRQPTGTGSPPWARLGCWGPFWTWHEVSGPHRIPQQPLPSPWKERQLASVAIPRGALPAPDDYPLTRLTRQDSLKLFPWAQQVLKSMSLDNMERHYWPWLGNWIPGCWSEP